MGTHPIFESDFDCLTEMLRAVSRVARGPVCGFRFLGTVTKDELIAHAKDPAVVVVDVRDHNEVAGGTIPAANWAHFPLGEFGEMAALNEKNFELLYDMKKPTKDQKVIFYCMKGVRSKTAGKLWESQTGATNVFHYAGGWYGWNDDWTKADWKKWSKGTGFPLA